MKPPTAANVAECSFWPNHQQLTFLPPFDVGKPFLQDFTVDHLARVLPSHSLDEISFEAEAEDKGQAFVLGCYYGD
ncbi:hypothetical protein TrST_g7228 [Triparma strigata]|uniref:Uncharacterized protein n=1 Tax=Triparma strigata TaxID=1606541 RepID=A0A9W6ZUL0_9STRA|nr:hypothetical protein TrST_g7228 [Triparma strigata]